MSLEELFEAHHEALHRFLARMTGDPDFAKDVVQEVFLAVARKPIPGDAPARAWLFQMGRNMARSGLRKGRRRRALLHGRSHRVPVASPEPAPDATAMRRQEVQAVRDALAELSEKERTILLMREEGFRHREIAEAVGTTTGSVGTMVARALAKLEARLGEGREEES